MSKRKPRPTQRARRARAERLRTLALCAISLGLGALASWYALRHAPSAAARHSARGALDPVSTPPTAYDWSAQPEPAFPIPAYAQFLSDVLLVIDPGHVGQRDPGGNWKRGPTGLREAVVNLNVALYLREFLLASGARVILTREQDQSLNLSDPDDLSDRAEIANAARADLLISIHHNAADGPKPNYTSLYYHMNPDHSPASLCAARHLLTGLNDALRLDDQKGCALAADTLIYPKSGFALLRQARVPAVLVESSFHTNPEEEQRLRDPVYNRREAYGLFLGLARWAQAGLPRVTLAERSPRAGKPIVVRLDDGLTSRGGFGGNAPKIIRSSLRVELDGAAAHYTANWTTREIAVTPPARGPRKLELLVDFENVFGQRVLHPRFSVDVAE